MAPGGFQCDLLQESEIKQLNLTKRGVLRTLFGKNCTFYILTAFLFVNKLYFGQAQLDSSQLQSPHFSAIFINIFAVFKEIVTCCLSSHLFRNISKMVDPTDEPIDLSMVDPNVSILQIKKLYNNSSQCIKYCDSKQPFNFVVVSL